jgi:hypothetical protein
MQTIFLGEYKIHNFVIGISSFSHGRSQSKIQNFVIGIGSFGQSNESGGIQISH